jgi:hypothetical protein
MPTLDKLVVIFWDGPEIAFKPTDDIEIITEDGSYYNATLDTLRNAILKGSVRWIKVNRSKVTVQSFKAPEHDWEEIEEDEEDLLGDVYYSILPETIALVIAF